MAFSGGLDSSYLAYRTLEDVDDELHLFWLDLSAITHETSNGTESFYQDLVPAENITAPKVIDWLTKNVRPVTYEVVKDVTYQREPKDFPGGGNSRGWRVFTMLKAAASIAKRDDCDRFIYGKSPENIRTLGWEVREQWYQKWWTKNVPGVAFEKPLLDWWHGRPHALAALPKPLRALILTCNTPLIVNGQPVACGGCDKCYLTAESERMLSQGMKPDVILDYLLRLRKAGPYVDSALKGDQRFGGDVTPANFPS
jgi:7-cyano-7-deazaguanine synthase in queuosine biosynthesis